MKHATALKYSKDITTQLPWQPR